MKRPAPLYYSTRDAKGAKGHLQPLNKVLWHGLAPDGGLYLPAFFPRLPQNFLSRFSGKSYEEVALAMLYPYMQAQWNEQQSFDMLSKSLEKFRLPQKLALKKISMPALSPKEFHGTDFGKRTSQAKEVDVFIAELFHGPTYAFKDFGLGFLAQVLGNLHKDRPLVVLGATSGDTGSAAVAAFKDLSACRVVILHPKGRIAERQRRQMTCSGNANVFNIAIEGSFDDCQRLLKQAFRRNFSLAQKSETKSQSLPLVSINSINWGRIMAQTVYYAVAMLELYRQGVLPQDSKSQDSQDGLCSFAIPSGNFGDAYAGSLAASMGLPIAKLVVATNANNILHSFFSRNQYKQAAVKQTLSPSMDILEASNFERFISELLDGDGKALSQLFSHFHKHGLLSLPEPLWKSAWKQKKSLFTSQEVSNAQVLSLIKTLYQKEGYLLDPHTAVGLHAALLTMSQTLEPKLKTKAMISFATAHPAKFPEPIQQSGLDIHAPDIAPQLSFFDTLLEKEEHFVTMENSQARLFEFLDNLALFEK